MNALPASGIFLFCAFAPIKAQQILKEIGVYGYAEGMRFEFSFGGIVRRTPAWEEGKEHPPLSPRKAEMLAKEKLKKLLKDPGKWSRSEIILNDSGDNRHWYYVVQFENHIGTGTQPPSMKIVVLMDGTIPEPTMVKYP